MGPTRIFSRRWLQALTCRSYLQLVRRTSWLSSARPAGRRGELETQGGTGELGSVFRASSPGMSPSPQELQNPKPPARPSPSSRSGDLALSVADGGEDSAAAAAAAAAEEKQQQDGQDADRKQRRDEKRERAAQRRLEKQQQVAERRKKLVDEGNFLLTEIAPTVADRGGFIERMQELIIDSAPFKSFGGFQLEDLSAINLATVRVLE